MAKFHVNPETGRASQCGASFKCPFGDLEDDHYATAAEARKSFERKMASEAEAEEAARKAKTAKRLGDPIIHPKVKQWSPGTRIYSGLDYDYDRSYDHPEDEDICRCGVINNVEIKGWGDDGEGLAEYAKEHLGLDRNEPLPDELKKDLTPFVTNFNSSDYEAEISPGYYGEEFSGIKVPDELKEVLAKHYYAQPDAGGPENILTYLRGKGYETTGERPLEAIKGALQAENNGRLIAKVAKTRKWRTAAINLSSITLPSESQQAAGEKDPRPLSSPYGKNSPTGEIAGVVLQRSDGTYELLDGYHRMGSLKAEGKRKKKYIILSSEVYREPSPYSYRWDKEPTWYKD
jgi:hypothetical protein